VHRNLTSLFFILLGFARVTVRYVYLQWDPVKKCQHVTRTIIRVSGFVTQITCVRIKERIRMYGISTEAT